MSKPIYRLVSMTCMGKYDPPGTMHEGPTVFVDDTDEVKNNPNYDPNKMRSMLFASVTIPDTLPPGSEIKIEYDSVLANGEKRNNCCFFAVDDRGAMMFTGT